MNKCVLGSFIMLTFAVFLNCIEEGLKVAKIVSLIAKHSLDDFGI